MNKYYHVSKLNDNKISLTPRVPDNYFTKNGYEENKTKRVSVCDTVDRCLMALSQNLEGKEYTVYEAIIEGQQIVDYTSLKNKVPDSQITHESWILSTTEFKKVGRIKVGKAKDKAYGYYYGKNNEHYAELYAWNYKYIKE